MYALISKTLLDGPQAQPREKPFEIWDTQVPGFLVRVQPTGKRSYYVQLNKKKRVRLATVGDVGFQTVADARTHAKGALGNAAVGREARSDLPGTSDGHTLRGFLTQVYAPWLRADKPDTADQTLDRLKLHYGAWYDLPLTAITLQKVEAWMTLRIRKGLAKTTVRRDIGTLSPVLSRAVAHKLLTENVVKLLPKPKIDRTPKVRYLDEEEEARLRAALLQRDAELIGARRSANDWRRERAYDLLPELQHVGDHLTPAVLLSINTGLRRGELLKLRWEDVNLKRRMLTVVGTNAKNAQTRYIPLNDEATRVLSQWQAAATTERVFNIDTGFKSAWGTLLERAAIKRFRWHDLRHHFASRLVQAGAPLNDVREVMGHGSMAMTLKYAHLAPKNIQNVVALLNLKKAA